MVGDFFYRILTIAFCQNVFCFGHEQDFLFFSTLKEVVNKVLITTRLIHALSSSRSQQTMVKQRPTRPQMSERAAAARPDSEPTCSCWLPDDTSWCLYPTLLPPCQWLGLDKTPEKSLSLFFISLLLSSLSVLTDFSWTGAADKTCSPGYLFHRGKKKKKTLFKIGFLLVEEHVDLCSIQVFGVLIQCRLNGWHSPAERTD